jgi:hypothetical protein
MHGVYVTTSFHNLTLIGLLLELHEGEKPFESRICSYNFQRFHSIRAKNVPNHSKQSNFHQNISSPIESLDAQKSFETTSYSSGYRPTKSPIKD